MPDQISNSVRDVFLFQGDTNPLPICCPTQKLGLEEAIAPQLTALVATNFFKRNFHSFLSKPDANAIDLSVRVTDKKILVRSLDGSGGEKEMNPFDDPQYDEIQKIHTAIMLAVHRLCKECKAPSPLPPPPSIEIPSSQEAAAVPIVSDQEFQTLLALQEKLYPSVFQTFSSEDKAEFHTVSQDVRNAIYYHAYLLIDPRDVEEPWRVGERLFEGEIVTAKDPSQALMASDQFRARALRHFLIHSLITDAKDQERLVRRLQELRKEEWDEFAKHHQYIPLSSEEESFEVKGLKTSIRHAVEVLQRMYSEGIVEDYRMLRLQEREMGARIHDAQDTD
ncbi:MAG: hypothetical protein JSS61_06590 [Verrucomicrobia bacterium]|nr:hypothetical protein [Verrucomicrobiota bacterium]